jgi:dUTP pyrophosphatase
MKIKLDEGAKVTRAHDTDAGLDLCARESQIVPARESAVFDTGVHIELTPGTVGMLKSKSGLNVIHGITKVEAGDKITQLVIMPIIIPELEFVDELEDTDRGNNGFGSSGK